MKQIKLFKWSILVVIIHLIIVLYFSSIIDPDAQIPRQWNPQGEVGSYTNLGFGLWFLWGLSAILVTFFTFFSYIDPRYRRQKERFDNILPPLTLLMASFMAIQHTIMLLWAIGIEVIQRQNLVFILIGFLFILLGNMLPKIPSNYFAGFRSPWTLSSEMNWHKTHRVGGYGLFISGCLMVIRGLIIISHPVISTIVLMAIMLPTMYPYLYSYILFRKEKLQADANNNSIEGENNETI